MNDCLINGNNRCKDIKISSSTFREKKGNSPGSNYISREIIFLKEDKVWQYYTNKTQEILLTTHPQKIIFKGWTLERRKRFQKEGIRWKRNDKIIFVCKSTQIFWIKQ